jgi:hypothetical protein
LCDKAAFLGDRIKGTYVFEAFTAAENNINCPGHQLLEFGMVGD